MKFCSTILLMGLGLCPIASFAAEDDTGQVGLSDAMGLGSSPIAAVAAEDDTTTDQVNLSGSISLVSAYVAKGGTSSPDNDETTLQAYLEAEYKGFYTGYWVSKVGFSFKEIQAEREGRTVSSSASDSYEHDIFLGYRNKFKGWGYSADIAAYIYPGGEDTVGYEGRAFVNKDLGLKNQNVVFGVQTYLNDTYFSNQGDTYISAGYSHPLPQDFTLNTSAAVAYYPDEGKYEGDSVNTTENFVWRHATIGVSHPLINDQSKAWINYIIGGEDRAGNDQKNLVVAGASYSF